MPDKEVALHAYTLAPDEERKLVARKADLTDANGNASIQLSSAVPIQELRCVVHDVTTTPRPLKIAADPNSVPRGTRLKMSLILLHNFALEARFGGLKPGQAIARLYASGAYDRPVVIPAPFRAREQNEPYTEEELFKLFSRGNFLNQLLARGYDVWLMRTRTGQNIHEQAAEFAELISYAAGELGPDGKVFVLGYSLGGLAARVATARYEADPEWRRMLGLRHPMPVHLIVFGDAPLEGAHINLCLQQFAWEQGQESNLNFNSCGAQQLMRQSVGLSADPSENHRRFFQDGEEL